MTTNARDAARAWAAGWQDAWRRGDGAAVGRLYADDARFRSHPMRTAGTGGAAAVEYARRVFAAETLVELWFGEPLVDGDRAAVEYWAVSLDADGAEISLAGCGVLRFGPDGRCVDDIEYWCEQPGRHRPPSAWGGSVTPPD
jgi:ketosteroid isomerase-like protein